VDKYNGFGRQSLLQKFNKEGNVVVSCMDIIISNNIFSNGGIIVKTRESLHSRKAIISLASIPLVG
jgi:hypothetical protein